MQIGINCFIDIEIRSIIASGGKIGTCDITKEQNIFVYDTKDLSQNTDLSAYFSEILDVYTPKSELPSDFPKNCLNFIENILMTDWSIFHLPNDKIKLVLQEICKDTYPKDSLLFTEKVGVEKLYNYDFLRNNCLMKESTWERFMSSIKSINRFHSNHINLDLLAELFNSPGMQITITKNEKYFYRGRICNEQGLEKQKMGPPPLEFATAGRANSKGIQCLYLASDITTTLHEIRARDLDYVAVARFSPAKELKIIDLANLEKISPFSMGAFDTEWFAINMPILKKISNEIAKPLRRQDSELDYLPAQYISDFVKSLGFDGICYRSTLNISGLNYAIFNYKKLVCMNVKLYHIDSLIYNTIPALS